MNGRPARHVPCLDRSLSTKATTLHLPRRTRSQQSLSEAARRPRPPPARLNARAAPAAPSDRLERSRTNLTNCAHAASGALARSHALTRPSRNLPSACPTAGYSTSEETAMAFRTVATTSSPSLRSQVAKRTLIEVVDVLDIEVVEGHHVLLGIARRVGHLDPDQPTGPDPRDDVLQPSSSGRTDAPARATGPRTVTARRTRLLHRMPRMTLPDRRAKAERLDVARAVGRGVESGEIA